MQKIIRKKLLLLSFILSCLAVQISYSQDSNKAIVGPKNNTRKNNDHFSNLFQQNYIGLYLKASVLPKADIDTYEGFYNLNSNLHSSFSGGFDYIINYNKLWSSYIGLYLNITTSNFHKFLPDSSLAESGIVSAYGPLSLVYYKDIYFRIAIPIMLARRFHFQKNGYWAFQAGINLNYSGFSEDERITMSVGDTNNHQIKVFDGIFQSNNDSKPWISISAGMSKNWILKNYNVAAISLFVDLSYTDYLICDYQITVPNKPITRGRYSVTGTGIGISLSYIFTGANKRLVRSYQK